MKTNPLLVSQRSHCRISSRRFSSQLHLARHRRAGVVLELLLSFPILLIAFLAAIQFGMLFSKIQQLALASRIGALAAAQSIALTPVNGPVPLSILQPITRQMNLISASPYGVLIEHNATNPQPVTPVLLASGTPACTQPTTPLPTSGRYVRVTVCVKVTQIAPDLLGMFGLDITTLNAQQTSVFRYEL